MSVTRLRWPDGRGWFTDSDLDRAPVDVDPDADLDRNPRRGDDTVDTPGIYGMGRFAARAGDVIDVTDPATVDHYVSRGWERVEDADTDYGQDTDTDDTDADP
jgi:hypothetical protein